MKIFTKQQKPKNLKKDVLGMQKIPGISIFICAKRGQGKSTLLWNLIDKLTTKHTKITVF